jgi:hypothetical protein
MWGDPTNGADIRLWSEAFNSDGKFFVGLSQTGMAVP